MLAIFLAISPDTPVSISSNIMVGREDLFASKDLIHNIRRENSPHEAT